MKTDDELGWLVRQRLDDISAASAYFREKGLVARAEVLAAGTEPGSAEDVGAIIFEREAVMADTNIKHYENPSDDELLEILAKAETYEGDWYHSYVSMTSDGGWTPLQQRVVDLPDTAGVYRIYSYTEFDDFVFPE
jgi:hypothetical protein